MDENQIQEIRELLASPEGQEVAGALEALEDFDDEEDDDVGAAFSAMEPKHAKAVANFIQTRESHIEHAYASAAAAKRMRDKVTPNTAITLGAGETVATGATLACLDSTGTALTLTTGMVICGVEAHVDAVDSDVLWQVADGAFKFPGDKIGPFDREASIGIFDPRATKHAAVTSALVDYLGKVYRNLANGTIVVPILVSHKSGSSATFPGITVYLYDPRCTNQRPASTSSFSSLSDMPFQNYVAALKAMKANAMPTQTKMEAAVQAVLAKNAGVTKIQGRKAQKLLKNTAASILGKYG